ncbi:MAG TPA: hypothetical protein VHT34_10060 [Clostridia bacterium]|nr:hypothetical protein [Clostridia bacterium]
MLVSNSIDDIDGGNIIYVKQAKGECVGIAGTSSLGSLTASSSFRSKSNCSFDGAETDL